MSFYGFFLGNILILFSALTAYASYISLDYAIQHSRKHSYANMVSFYLGKKVATIFIIFLICTNFMGSTIYPAVGWGFLSDLISGPLDLPIANSNYNTVDEYAPKVWLARAVSMTLLMLLTLLVTLRKSFGGLRYLSFLSFVTIIFSLGVVVFQSPMFYLYYKDKEIYETDFFPKVSGISRHWITGLSTMFLSFLITPLFFYLRGELIDKSPKKVKQVIGFTISLELILYLVVSNVGYLCFGNNLTPPILTLRKPLRKKNIFLNYLAGMNDTLMVVVRVIFIPVTLMHIPTNLFSLRDQIYTYNGVKRTFKNHVILSFTLTLLVFIVPTIYPSVLGIFGIFGGIFVVTIALIFPFWLLAEIGRKLIYFFIFLGREKRRFMEYGSKMVVFCSVLLTIASTSVSVYDLLASYNISTIDI